MANLVVKRGRAKPLWFGHPWLYSEAVDRVDADAAPGDDVRVVDSDGKFLGRGFYNPRSQIVVRMGSRRDEPLDGAWLRAGLVRARDLRARLCLPSERTDAYRLVNSEGDWLPGLIVDVLGDAAVVQMTTLAMKRREADVFDAVAEVVAPRTVYETAAGGVAQIEGFSAQSRVARGEPRSQVVCRENGFVLEVEPLAGQKTGAFLDQRENRLRVERLARGARVLDLYSYVGGFAMAAARGGATATTAVDASARALERAAHHFELNGLGGLTTVENDAFRYLEQAPAGGFDLIVCDPPKFARARKDVEAALKGYRRLNQLALQALAPDGILCTASCSQLIDAVELERVVAAAAKDAGRRVQVLEVASQAPDHVVPVAFPEGRYLKFLVCRAP
ncbi:MAG TPA: class I SAM-dependent rRNA methyltransferase [Haliangiales bacterium]|nr:class I SAM-dependent rRNA methyltransferase [Haliangiales bacterium]